MLKLYNTKTKSIETFTPINPPHVSIYSCGPTVYHFAHLGNLRAYICADTLRRVLTTCGYVVNHVINITDVGHLTSDGDTGEDKLEKGSRREGKTAWDVALIYENAFKEDLTRLNIPLIHYSFPRATDHIKEQIDLISTLEQKGYTYTLPDGVYFDTSRFLAYGEFAHLDIEGLRAGARVEEHDGKRNPTDFALWKLSPHDEKRQMEWDSPWGVGFPGWHIECSAMSMKYLGTHFDIHTGGIDHIPVHHTNEIAQSVCATGETYVNYWMHVNFLHDKTGKMSKSNEDFLTLSSLIHKKYSPLAFRYFILTASYRKELAFSYEALDAASLAYKKLCDFVQSHKKDTGVLIPTCMESFTAALYDDLNTSEAIASMWIMMRDYGTTHKEDVAATLLRMGDILGLTFEGDHKEVGIPEIVLHLLKEREKAREDKNFTLADTLREEIRKHGFLLKDTPHGQEVVRK